MAEESIQREPERRKAGQTARYGKGVSTMIGLGGKDGKTFSRLIMTPNELASLKLSEALTKYQEYTPEGREQIRHEFVNMPSLRTMNMKVLAATLNFLRALDQQGTPLGPEAFKDENIIPYLAQLLPTTKISDEEYQRLVLRFKAQIFAYIRAINIFRST